MSIIDVCREVARERKCEDSRQKQVISAAVASKQCTGHILGLARCHQTQIETNTGIQLSAISLAIPFAVRYVGFVLSRFTVRPDGRTPFQYLLGTPYVSPLCMLGESVFALIPDQEVRAAKLTNIWISGCWWGRDASLDEHLVGTKHGLLECRSVCRKPPGEQWSRRETIEARGTKWNFDVEMDSGISGPLGTSRPHEGMPTATAPREISTVPPLAPPPEEHVPEIRVHSNNGGGDVVAKMEMVIYENEGDRQSRPLHKHSHSAYFRLAERGRQIDRYWPDHHCAEVTGMQERHLRDDGVLVTLCHFEDRYITIVSTVMVTAVTYLG